LPANKKKKKGTTKDMKQKKEYLHSTIGAQGEGMEKDGNPKKSKRIKWKIYKWQSFVESKFACIVKGRLAKTRMGIRTHG